MPTPTATATATPILPLKAALRALLAADAPLIALLGGPRVYDDVPRGAPVPYLAFAEATCRDNGTTGDAGHVTELTLLVWSRAGGTREALIVADRASQLIEDANPPVAGHRLVNARVTATELRRTPEKDLTRAALKLRLVTEVI